MGRDEDPWVCRRRRHSHRSSGDDLGFVVVTHPFHPLNGQRLEVLFVKRRGAETVFVCAGGVGGSGDDAVVVDRSGLSRRGRIGCRSRGWPICRGDTRHQGLLIVMPGHDILLCDEYTQERSVESCRRGRCWIGDVGWWRGSATWSRC